MAIQTLIFDKRRWTLDRARKWLRDHGFVASKVDEPSGAGTMRFRQFPPGECAGGFQTLAENFPPGVQAVNCQRRLGESDEGIADLAGSIGESKAPGQLDLTLMTEGRSKNGFNWSDVLDKVARLSVGRPLQALEFSSSRFKKFFDHMFTQTRLLPERIREMIPKLFHNTTVGVIQEARVVGDAPHRRIVARAELKPGAEGFAWLLRQMKRLGQKLPGVSIFVDRGQYQAEPSAEGLDIRDLFRVSHFDVVTQPSAGGSIQAVLESFAAGEGTMKLYDLLVRLLPDHKSALEKAIAESDRTGLSRAQLKDLLPDELYEEAARALAEAEELVKGEDSDDDDEGDAGGDNDATADDDADDTDDAAGASGNGARAEAADRGFMGGAKGRKRKKKGGAMAESVEDRVARLERARSEDYLDRALSESRLPDIAVETTRDRFSGVDFTRSDVDAFVERMRKRYGKAAETAPPVLPAAIVESGLNDGDKLVDALEAMMMRRKEHPDSKVPAFRGIRHAYQLISGDMLCEGVGHYSRRRRDHGLAESYDWEANPFFLQLRAARGHDYALAEAVNTGAFPLILADVMHKRMQREYAEVGLDQWRRFATVENVSDFKTWRIQRFGEYGTLPTVAENGAYTALTTPTEEEVTLQIAKFGGTESLTWESVKNDDTRRFVQLPRKLSRAAAWTLHTDFFDMFALNETIHDSVALFDATHNNVGPTTLLSNSVLADMIQVLRLQTDLDAVRAIGAQPKYLLHPIDLAELVHEILRSGSPATPLEASAVGNNNVATVNSRYGIEPLEVPHFSDANDTFLVADPMTVEGAAVAFLDGRDTPELFIQDLATVGSWFDRDAQTLKVRFLYDKVIVDERAFVNNIVA